MLTLRRNKLRDDASFVSAPGRPVLLVTLEAPLDQEAATFAIDTAVECGQPLIVANIVEIPLGPLSIFMGYGGVHTDAETESLHASAMLAHELGVEVERLRILSPHPVEALLELAAERRPGVLVFGPDRKVARQRLYRRAAKRVRDRAACLVWLPDD